LDVWETIRIRCVRDGEPQKRVARELGISKNTLKKYVRSLCAPHVNVAIRRSKVDAYQAHIDEWLRETPRITARRIASLLHERVDANIAIGERALRRYVANRRRILVPKEAFVRAVYAAGDQAQFDFTSVTVTIAGVLVTLQLFVMRLSYSGRLYARASWRCDQPALFTGILEALVTFGGVPKEALFDNASTAVTRVLRGRSRDENATFRSFCGALALPIAFAAPAKGNEKGGVEGANHYLQDNFFTPVPAFNSVADLNAALAALCEADQMREHSSHHESIAIRFAREEAVLRALPQPLPRPCVIRPAHINKFSEITLDTNRYSVPTQYAHRHAFVEVYDTRLRIIIDDAVVAEHPRAPGRGEMYLDPRHFLELLAHKHRAAQHAVVLSDGRLPESFLTLRDRYRTRSEGHASKAWTTVLLLLKEHSAEAVDAAIVQAMARGTDDPAAIALLLTQRSRPSRPTALSSTAHPRMPRAIVAPVDLSVYANTELAERAS
jgi:transposase